MRGEFVIARGNATKLLEAGEQVFDQVPGLMAMPIPSARRKPIDSGWNDETGVRLHFANDNHCFWPLNDRRRRGRCRLGAVFGAAAFL